MTTATSSPAPLLLPTHSSSPPAPAPVLASWQQVLAAYRDAWDAIDGVDDHHTAFLAMHVIANMVETYKEHLTTRLPRDGDLANLTHLKDRIDASYVRHNTFADEAHLDYPALRRQTLAALQQLREDTTRKCALHAIALASNAFPALSYSSSIDELHNVEAAVHLIESYNALKPLFVQEFDMKSLAQAMQAIAAQEAQGFPDYKDEQFAVLFEALTLRIGHLHLANTKRKA